MYPTREFARHTRGTARIEAPIEDVWDIVQNSPTNNQSLFPSAERVAFQPDDEPVRIGTELTGELPRVARFGGMIVMRVVEFNPEDYYLVLQNERADMRFLQNRQSLLELRRTNNNKDHTDLSMAVDLRLPFPYNGLNGLISTQFRSNLQSIGQALTERVNTIAH